MQHTHVKLSAQKDDVLHVIYHNTLAEFITIPPRDATQRLCEICGGGEGVNYRNIPTGLCNSKAREESWNIATPRHVCKFWIPSVVAWYFSTHTCNSTIVSLRAARAVMAEWRDFSTTQLKASQRNTQPDEQISSRCGTTRNTSLGNTIFFSLSRKTKLLKKEKNKNRKQQFCSIFIF